MSYNKAALANPRPGDYWHYWHYWHEMWVPYFLVLEVQGEMVAIAEKRIVDKDGWTFDVSSARWVHRSYLEHRLLYTSEDSTSTRVDCVNNLSKVQDYIDEWKQRAVPVPPKQETQSEYHVWTIDRGATTPKAWL